MEAIRLVSSVNARRKLVLALLCAAAWAIAADAPKEIVPVDATASSTQAASKALRNMLDGSGLREMAPGSGVWVHSNDAFHDRGVERGTMWASGYPNGQADTTPTVTFDLGRVCEIGSFRVWNYNEKGWTDHGLKEVDVSASTDGKGFAPLGTAIFEQASGDDDYEGQVVSFKEPAKARYVRLQCKSTWKGSDNAGLSEIRFYPTGAGAKDAIAPSVKPTVRAKPETNRPNPPRPAVPGAENIVFPLDSGIIDVTAEPYGAKGDGTMDDTRAIQQALNDYPNAGAIIYLPNGTYVISKTLRWPHGRGGGAEEKNTILQGQSAKGTILKLKDNCLGFGDPKQPKAMIWTGQRPAQRFRNAIRNLMVDTGKGNAGAVGVQFMANNQGCMRDVVIRSGDGKGPIGLDMAYTDEIGPCLVKNVTVVGFDVGIEMGYGVNGMTLEHITLEGQNQYGIRNDDQCVTIRGLKSTNAVPAVRNGGGSSLLAIIDSQLTGTGGAADKPAIENTGALFARNIKTSGYKQAIQSASAGVMQADVTEFVSHPATSLFPSPGYSLGLPIKETPDMPWDDLKDWASPTQFGGAPNDDGDDTEAIQKAIDSGKTTVYLPRGTFRVKGTVIIRGNVRRIIGCEATLDVMPPLAGQAAPMFRFVDGGQPLVVFERVSTNFARGPFCFLEHASSRTLVLSSIAINFQQTGSYRNTGTGALFIDDVVGGDWHFRGQPVWARQFNVENTGTHITNDGATLWILNLKTEQGGTLIETKGGGKTECIGGFCYTCVPAGDAPMFTNENSSVSITIGEACFIGKPYLTVARETRAGETKLLKNRDLPGRVGGCLIPLYVGYKPENAAEKK